MGRFEELSTEQQEPLFKLVEFQRKSGRDIKFSRNGENIYPENSTKAVTVADESIIGILVDCKYIYLHRHETLPESTGRVRVGPSSSPELRLKQLGLNYYDWMQKSPRHRWWAEQKDAWSSESKAAIVSLIVSILTIIISNGLGY